MIIGVIIIIFSDVKSAEAIGTNLPPQQRVVSIMPDRDASRLIRPSKVNIHLEKHPELMMPSFSKNVKKPREISLPVGFYLMEDRFLRRPDRKVRGGDLTEIGVFLAFIGIMLLMPSNSQGFVAPGIRVVQPHEQKIYGNNRPNHNFGYVKNSMRITSVSGATQNAGSEKKEPGKVSYEYQEVMQELNRQSSKKMVEIQVGDQIYSLKSYCEDASELDYKFADQMYDSIRECDTDICDIAKNLVINVRRPNLNKGEPNLDLVVDGPASYEDVYVKNPIDTKKFPPAKKKPESFNKMTKRIGEKITKQKGGSDKVLHIVDLEQIPSEIKENFSKKITEGAGSPKDIKFIN